jgi:4a-hydroxytetrahydrobiopterin dehydratase
LTDAEIEALLPQIEGWEVKEVDEMKRLEKVFKLKNFTQALELTNKIGGLHKNDFIMAAKTDELL